MDVSVIITAYNVECYISRAIDSALAQQNVQLEIIVVDDASTDGTSDIISKYSSNPPPNGEGIIKSIKLPTNKGPAAARNAGIALATGNWIAILDGDDAFEPDRLARCLSIATEKKADAVVDNLMVIRETDGKEFPMFPPEIFSRLTALDAATFIKGTLCPLPLREGARARGPSSSLLQRSPHPSPPPQGGRELRKNNYTLGYLKPLFSSHFLKQHRLLYDTTLRIGEDYQLMLEALLLGAHCVIQPTQGYRYTARAGSISHRLSLIDISRMMQADEKLLRRHTLDNKALIAQLKRTRLLKQEYAYTQLIQALKQKNWRDGVQAIATHPVCLWLLHRPLNVRLKRLLRHE